VILTSGAFTRPDKHTKNYGLMGFNGDYGGSINPKTGMLVDIPGLVNSHITNWKDPPCD
jgi:hypothetical protein